MATKLLPRRGLLLAVFCVLLAAAPAAFAASGEELFIKRCAGCHMIGAGALIGPDLKDVGTRRTADWLLRFIKSPKAMSDAGDADAVALIKAFPVLMPDTVLSDDEIKDVLAFIAARSAPPPAPPPPLEPAPKPAAPVTEERAGPPPWLVAPLIAALALTAWSLVRPRRPSA